MADLNTNTIAMTDNRNNWKLADVHHTTMLLPGPYKEYVKGLISVLNATTLQGMIESHDELVLAAFSDKQPRLPFSELDIRLEMRGASDDYKVEYERIIDLMVRRLGLQEDGKKAIEEQDELRARYYYASDYATAYLIRGYYKMLTETRAGRGLPTAVLKILSPEAPANE